MVFQTKCRPLLCLEKKHLQGRLLALRVKVAGHDLPLVSLHSPLQRQNFTSNTSNVAMGAQTVGKGTSESNSMLLGHFNARGKKHVIPIQRSSIGTIGVEEEISKAK